MTRPERTAHLIFAVAGSYGLILRAQGRTPVPALAFATVDLSIAASFVYAWRQLPES